MHVALLHTALAFSPPEAAVDAPLTGVVCSILDHGAVGDNHTLNTPAIQAAIDACHLAAPEGSTVLVPSGAYRTASIHLRSNLRLHLASGAGLYGSSDPSDYSVSLQWFGGRHVANFDALIRGVNLTNVSVTGSNGAALPGNASIIDGVGWRWWCWAKAEGSGMPLYQPWCREFNPNNETLPNQGRPRLINIFNSSGVTLSGFTAQNSPQWTVHVQNSRNVVIRTLTVLSPRAVGNTDGIDPESSENVLVEDSYVDVGDVAVSIKSYNITPDGGVSTGIPCRRVMMRRLTLRSRNWCIGSGTFGGVSEVLFEDSTIGTPGDASAPVPWALRFKSHRWFSGPIENITVRRIAIGVVGSTPWMYPTGRGGVWQLGLTYGGKEPSPWSGLFPRVRNVTFEDVTVDAADYAGQIHGLNDSCFEHLTFRNVSIRGGSAASGLSADEGGWSCAYVQQSTFVTESVTPPFGSCALCTLSVRHEKRHPRFSDFTVTPRSPAPPTPHILYSYRRRV